MENPEQKFGFMSKEFIGARRETQLPVEEIKNTISWVNPAFTEIPIKLIEGQPTKLGLFFTPTPEKAVGQTKNLTISPEIRTGRAGVLDPVIFQDNERRLYRDIDLKGMGGFRRNTETGKFAVSSPRIIPKDTVFGGRAYEEGMWDLGYALTDRDRSEELLKNGIRTYRVIAFIKPEEIIDDEGNKISIQEAKSRGLLFENSNPIIEARAFTTRERIGYISRNEGLRTQLALKDGKLVVAQELGINPDSFSTAEYVEWFAKTFGQQLAKLRKLGFYHGFLHSQNVTLDCKIVDLDSVSEAGNKNSLLYEEDFEKAHGTFMEFLSAISKQEDIGDKNYYIDLFETSYKAELRSSKLGKILKGLFKKNN